MSARYVAALAGIHNTEQARKLPDCTARSLLIEACRGALADAGLGLEDVDGLSAADQTRSAIYDLGLGPVWQGAQKGIAMVHEAVAAIELGLAEVILIASAAAGVHTTPSSTAPWTRPNNEFVAPWGMFTAAEFALVARRHMLTFGTTEKQMAIVAATIRNNGHVNPDAVYHGRGPFEPAQVLASRMIADPFHLLDCSMTSEGGCAIAVVRDGRAQSDTAPIYMLGGATDVFGPAYTYPPSFDLHGRRADYRNGMVGARAADIAFSNARLNRTDVDVAELYDPFSFEVIRQLEAFGFCPPGEGGPFVEDGGIAADGILPVTTDGGLMSFSHPGSSPQMLQRVIRGVQQLRGTAGARQVSGAEVALCSSGGAGALFSSLILLGKERPWPSS